ncbi:MAG: neutral/alkaline non-lysosomal ceramidase N-terminal domain-containing protein, partial [Anaerolineae bacterium]
MSETKIGGLSAEPNQIRVGAGKADITPAVGTPLSGFIFRENKPSTEIESPLWVRVMCLRQGDALYWLVGLDLLAVSATLRDVLLEALAQAFGQLFAPDRCVLAATHTHSAPPVAPLEGEADVDPAYVALLQERVVQAAQQALDSQQVAALWCSEVAVPSLTYNRRSVLADGRVVMAAVPDAPVMRRGPVDDRLTLLAWQDSGQRTLAAAVHWACHGVALNTQAISGDIPGLIAASVEAVLGAPCVYLQGATGDVNPTVVAAGPQELAAWWGGFEPYLRQAVA